jgi:hypothetical protein
VRCGDYQRERRNERKRANKIKRKRKKGKKIKDKNKETEMKRQAGVSYIRFAVFCVMMPCNPVGSC